MALLTRAVWWLVPGYLLAAAAFELALALTAAGIGPQPGDGPAADGAISLIALFAMLAGVVVVALSFPYVAPRWAVASLAPSAAAFVVAHYYSYDPYYAPTLRRYSDGGAVPPAFVFVMVGAALVAGLLMWRVPRLGAVVTSLALFFLTATYVFAGGGH